MKQAKDTIIPILFYLFPFMVIAPGVIWKSQLLFFVTMGGIIIAFQIKNVFVKTFILYAVLWQMCIFIGYFHKGISTGNGLSIILSLMGGGIVYKFVSEGAFPKEDWYSVIRVVVLIQVIIGILQYFGLNLVVLALEHFTPVRADLPHITGSLGNRNFIAAFVAISLPMFADWKAVEIKGINIAVIALIAFLCFCLSPGTLAAFIGIAVYYVYDRRLRHGLLYIMLSMVAAVVFAAAYILITGHHVNDFVLMGTQFEELRLTGMVFTDSSPGDIGRFGMWMTAAWLLLHDWFAFIFGFGPGASWGKPYPLHSEYVSMWYQFGIVGMTLMFSYLWSTIKMLWKSEDSVLFTSFCIICLDMVGNFPAEVASTAFLIIIICGLIERERLCLKEDS